MLQQTKVSAVVPYYERWLKRFPTVHALAQAPLDDALHAWAGLGYYSRARNLHRGAQEVVAHYSGQLPREVKELCKLPGIGRYTAGAIASIAFHNNAAVVDGNVARVLARLYAINKNIKAPSTIKHLWQLADTLVPNKNAGDFNQGLMELGATVCTPTKPQCSACPLEGICLARHRDLVNVLPIVPSRPRNQDLPRLRQTAGWIEKRGRVLLMRRTSQGLYGGLWELPTAQTKIGLKKLLPGLDIASAQYATQHQQTLTHRQLLVKVWRIQLHGQANGATTERHYNKHVWQPVSKLTSLGTSALTRAIIQQYWEHDRWKKIAKQ